MRKGFPADSSQIARCTRPSRAKKRARNLLIWFRASPARACHPLSAHVLARVNIRQNARPAAPSAKKRPAREIVGSLREERKKKRNCLLLLDRRGSQAFCVTALHFVALWQKSKARKEGARGTRPLHQRAQVFKKKGEMKAMFQLNAEIYTFE